MFGISKTMILSIMTTVVSVITLLMGEQWIMAYPDVVAWMGIVVGILTGILRQVTSKGMAGFLKVKDE